MYEHQMKNYQQEMAAREKNAANRQKVDTKYKGVDTVLTGPMAKVTSPQDSARAPPEGFDIEAKRQQMEYAKDQDRSSLKKRDSVVQLSPSSLDDDYGFDDSEDNSASGFDSPTKTTETSFTPPEIVEEPPIWSPTPPATRAEYVKSRMENERLPKGLKAIMDPRYILRYVISLAHSTFTHMI
jgi:hypothetical protein